MHNSPSTWGVGVIFVPMLGGLIVIWIIERFAHDERGLSVPEIMYKIRSKDARVQPSVALAKTFASAISIGSGASIGREGPVIQIGALFGSLLCDVINLSFEKRNILIAAGVGASTGAMFNAPLAGVAFAVELFLLSFNLFSIIIIAIAAATGTYISNLLIGDGPTFVVQQIGDITNYSTLLIYFVLFVIFGIILGLIAILFIRGIYWFEDIFNHLFKSPYLRHLIAMLVVGMMLYVFVIFYGHYYIEGIGFATIQDCLNLVISNPWLLLFIFLCKYLATCLSIGSGSSGGIFSPALFLGATIGTFFGIVVNYLFPTIGIKPVIFALAGMGGMVSSSTGAVITGVLLTFEMSREIYSILPLIITVIIAYLVRRQICRESIYTLKLIRRGIKYPLDHQK